MPPWACADGKTIGKLRKESPPPYGLSRVTYDPAMRPTHRHPTHPGQVLLHEFLEPAGISRSALARHIGVSPRHVGGIVRGKRGVTAETAWMLAQAFETSPELWVNLQTSYDLARSRPARKTKPLRAS